MRDFRFSTNIAFAILVSGMLSAAMAQPNHDKQEAEQILDATGVKGGLIVHIGCGDGRLTAALRADGSYLVHGLDTSAENVKNAREYISSLGLYGPVAVNRFDGRRLPYIDNLVNLIVSEDLGDVPMAEVMRALAPNGVAYIRENGRWTKTVKPWPDDIDQWTHFLHGPDNNAVAKDSVVGPPVHLQWLSGPMHLRSHENLNSVSALVSARGRVFYIIDEGPTAIIEPSRWRLVARDAFNGVLLWKHNIGPWEGHFRLFRSGPPQIARRLVAVGDRVYVTLGYGKQVAAFDAATGRTVRTYDQTKGATEIVCDSGRLYVVVGTIGKPDYPKIPQAFAPSPQPKDDGIVALDADSGRVLWKVKDEDTSTVMPTTLAVSEGRVFFENTREVLCLNANSGTKEWRAERPVYTERLSWSAPTLVVHDGVVLSADGSTGGLPPVVPRGGSQVKWILSDQDIRKHPLGDLVAFNAKTGKRLWTGTSLQGFCNPGDLFVIDGLVWAGGDVSPQQRGLTTAVDLQTGKLKKDFSGNFPPVSGHARCYRDKATERFILFAGRGVDFVSVDNWNMNTNPWVRGTCQYGVMPCNGLLYSPPDSCACMPGMRVFGFAAMAPKRQQPEIKNQKYENLEKGPAYEQSPTSDIRPPSSDSWPTYRGDPARSGRTDSKVSTELKPLWHKKIGSRLSSLTISDGRVYASSVDTHTVYALNADSGAVLWSRTVGGRVDSPPTICGQAVLFGSHDGCVYCLRARDGALAWRFRAAPRKRFTVANGAVESVWPVEGSVLAWNGLAWFAAGRSSFLDGGIRLYGLDIASGKCVASTLLNARPPDANESPARQPTPPTLPDILSASGDEMYMGWMGFDKEGRVEKAVKPHLFSATGFLDGTWWHRTYWQYGTWMRGGFGGWPQAARQVPAGRLLVVTDDLIFGFGRSVYDPGNPNGAHAGHVGLVKDTYQDMGHIDYSQNTYRLFCALKKSQAVPRNKAKRRGIEYKWQEHVPMLVRGMLLADRTLFIAGPSIGKNLSGLDKLDTVQPGLLWAVSSDDGTKLAQYKLAAAPVLDGIAAEGGRLYISMTDGRVLCLAKK
jgi:outer membrane protein assembly factor BamB